MKKGFLGAAALAVVLSMTPAFAGSSFDGKILGGLSGYGSTGDSMSGGYGQGHSTHTNSWTFTNTGGSSTSQAGHTGYTQATTFAYSGGGNYSGASGPGYSESGSQSGAEVGGMSGAITGKIHFKSH